MWLHRCVKCWQFQRSSFLLKYKGSMISLFVKMSLKSSYKVPEFSPAEVGRVRGWELLIGRKRTSSRLLVAKRILITPGSFPYSHFRSLTIECPSGSNNFSLTIKCGLANARCLIISISLSLSYSDCLLVFQFFQTQPEEYLRPRALGSMQGERSRLLSHSHL